MGLHVLLGRLLLILLSELLGLLTLAALLALLGGLILDGIPVDVLEILTVGELLLEHLLAFGLEGVLLFLGKGGEVGHLLDHLLGDLGRDGVNLGLLNSLEGDGTGESGDQSGSENFHRYLWRKVCSLVFLL